MTRLFRTERFKKDFRRLPTAIQDRLPGVLERLVVNRRHPGLRVKKMDGVRDIWELRATDNDRVTFQVIQEGILLRRIGTHDALRQPSHAPPRRGMELRQSTGHRRMSPIRGPIV